MPLGSHGPLVVFSDLCHGSNLKRNLFGSIVGDLATVRKMTGWYSGL